MTFSFEGASLKQYTESNGLDASRVDFQKGSKSPFESARGGKLSQMGRVAVSLEMGTRGFMRDMAGGDRKSSPLVKDFHKEADGNLYRNQLGDTQTATAPSRKNEAGLTHVDFKDHHDPVQYWQHTASLMAGAEHGNHANVHQISDAGLKKADKAAFRHVG
jgi:hypothetical protein